MTTTTSSLPTAAAIAAAYRRVDRRNGYDRVRVDLHGETLSFRRYDVDGAWRLTHRTGPAGSQACNVIVGLDLETVLDQAVA